MGKKLQLTILLICAITAIAIPTYNFIKLSSEKNEIDEISSLFSEISEVLSENTELSFTSSAKKSQKIILWDYALLSAAPTPITDNGFHKDTILAIDRIENASLKMYDDYEVIKKTVGNNFILHLLKKK